MKVYLPNVRHFIYCEKSKQMYNPREYARREEMFLKNERGRHSDLAIPELVSVFLEAGTKFSQENDTFAENFWCFLG